ncbi:3 beta-hydroxysteroid dehydrogenase/Delta 5--_4-isomerase [bioreactor metagenome]|uniref:3 beta-hydroxysteroid dehydrogenase/Delta 5-->4-isomerase n=1 Tax=bioreactor metagenome TaxID=1076179 RepID=A0A644UCZ8_9ZZZZ
MLKVLVTGASGFIGSTLVEKLLEEGYEVTAGIRKSSSRKYLQDQRISFIDLPYDNAKELERILKEENFHAIFHLAGLTKAQKKEDFYKVNFGYVKNLVDALQNTSTKLIFFSSFAAHGPGEETTFCECKVEDLNKPNTEYGKAKLQAEEYIRDYFKGKYIILRPTGVYGPRETDYFVYFQTINNHLEPYLGFIPQRLTFVYVDDLVDVSILAMQSEISGKTYFVSDGKLYLDTEFAQITKKVLNTWTIKLKFPLFIVKWISSLMEFIGKLIGKSFTLNKDKFNILKARNWNCGIEDLKKDLGYSPKVDLEKGVEKSISWYKQEKWLK